MDNIEEILKALSDQTRYHIVSLLLQSDFCVGSLAKRTGLSQAAVSQHLRLLREAGLVRGEKRGYFTHYQVNRDLLKEVGYELVELSSIAANGSECCESFERHCHVVTERRSDQLSDCPCTHPELKPKDGKYSEKQIKECHGDEAVHPCEENYEQE